MKSLDLKGQRFGRLLVLDKAPNQGKRTAWKCKCDCGNEVIVLTEKLRRNDSSPTRSCGCLQKESREKIKKNRVNQKFGRLLVLYQNGHASNNQILWHCRCDCGKELDVQSNNLINGHTRSCGCLASEIRKTSYNDLTNKKFGYLTVLGLDEQSRENKDKIKWICRCNCGKIVSVQANNLISGNSTSCGCRKKSKGEEKIAEILKTANIPFEEQKIFDTCIFPNTKYYAKFDFYVNNKYLIEYDGELHFKSVEQFGGEKTLKILKQEMNLKINGVREIILN